MSLFSGFLYAIDTLLYTPPVYVAMGAALTTGSILLFRRFRGTATVLAIVGGAVYTGALIFEASIGPLWVGSNAVKFDAADTASRLGEVCFAVGFIWFAAKLTRGSK